MTAQGLAQPREHEQPCQKCGRAHARCAAHNRQGTPCGLWPLAGQRVCGLHGGRTPNALRRASERLVEQQARRTLASLANEPEPVTDPVGALERLAGEVVALVSVLRGFVSDLEEIRYKGGIGAGFEQLRGEMSFYMSSLQRAESVLSSIVKLDLDARRVRIAEAQASLVVAAVTSTLRALGLSAEQQRRARAMLARELGSATPAAIEAGHGVHTYAAECMTVPASQAQAPASRPGQRPAYSGQSDGEEKSQVREARRVR